MAKMAMKGGKPENKSNGSLVIVIALLVVVLIALVVAIVLLLGRKDKDSGNAMQTETEASSSREVAGSARTILDEDSANNVMDEMREEVAEGMFECEMSMTWTFENGSAESKDAYVANNTNNTHPIYFDVYLQDSEELLYSSPVLPVGGKLTNFKLDKELPAGEYKATVMYTLLKDEKSQEEISSAGFVITINVLN